MKRSYFWAKIFSVTAFVLVEAYLVGCGKIDGLPVQSTGTIPGLPAPAPNPPIGVVDDSAGFYVQARSSEKYTYVSHKGNTTMSTKCTAVAGELNTCYIEGQELDLFFNGVEIQYNVPTTLCSYFIVKPYSYFYRRAGAGDATAIIDTDKNGDTGRDNDNDGVINTAYTTPPCTYNYTADGVNCCGGTYTVTKRTWDTTGGAYTSAVETNQSWGGNPANCLAGPDTKTASKDSLNRPITAIQYVGTTGVNAVYTVDAPIGLSKGTNIHVANYWDSADFTGTSGVPEAFTSVTTSQGTFSTSQVYDFTCLDSSSEVVAEIQLYVRSWTKKSNFLDLVANPSLYQISGAEPAPWNVGYDFYDWPNWHSYAAPGSTTQPGFPYLDQ